MANADSDEPHCHTLASLPPELIALVAEGLDTCGLARFAAASTLCRAAAHSELRAALRAAVQRSLVLHLVPGALHDGSSLPRLERLARARDALVRCPYFCVPDDLVAIPPGAFRGCSYLTSPLTLPTSLTTIGDRAFEGTSLTGITLPATLTNIGTCAFRCTPLAQLTLPPTLATVGLGAFSSCIFLREVHLPAGLTAIPNRAFRGCTSLATVALPANLTTIGDYSFAGCCSLVEILLPATLTSIGDYAFRGCSSLASLRGFPASFTAGYPTIGRDAFEGTRFTSNRLE